MLIQRTMVQVLNVFLLVRSGKLIAIQSTQIDEQVSNSSLSSSLEYSSLWECNDLHDVTYHLNDAIVGPSVFWEYSEYFVGIDENTNEKLYDATPVKCLDCSYIPLATSIVTDGHDMATGAMQVQLGWFPDKGNSKKWRALAH